jgi:hypothetical protein
VRNGSNSPLCTCDNLLLTVTPWPGPATPGLAPTVSARFLQNPTILIVGVNRHNSIIVTASANGCTTTSSVVTVNPLPIASVESAGKIPASAPQSTTLSVGARYQWSPAGLSNLTTSSTRRPASTAPTIYTVTVTNATGCQATDRNAGTRATPVPPYRPTNHLRR